jgi:hypothetical protein
MTPGSQRSISVLRFGKAGARPKVYMQAAIHANEMPGTMAMHHLMPLLAEADKKGLIQGEIILVPTVNPIGQAQLVGNSHAGRYNLLLAAFNNQPSVAPGIVSLGIGANFTSYGEVAIGFSDASGLWNVNLQGPSGLVSGTSIWLQAVVFDPANFTLPLSASNVLPVRVF